MTRDIVEVNDFVVLIEQSVSDRTIVDACRFNEEIIGLAFYGSGNVELNIEYGTGSNQYNNTKGFAMSFFVNQEAEFIHTISHKKPLQSIVIVTALKNLPKLPPQEAEIFKSFLQDHVKPVGNYVEGPNFFMGHEMQNAVDKIFKTTYSGPTRMMFLKSQVTELISHFFAYVSQDAPKTEGIKEEDREKLYQAKEIISENMEAPPSLKELSKLIGLNSYKLKKNFKALFGLPVYKYLQRERLIKAHELLTTDKLTIQEAAWSVGYESISSFSTAFLKQYGFRPSEIKR